MMLALQLSGILQSPCGNGMPAGAKAGRSERFRQEIQLMLMMLGLPLSEIRVELL